MLETLNSLLISKEDGHLFKIVRERLSIVIEVL